MWVVLFLKPFVSNFKYFNKMPCQYCKLPGHTQYQCDADINVYLGQITGMIERNPFALRHQFQEINKLYKKPLLSLICVRLGYCASVNKPLLIDNIISKDYPFIFVFFNRFHILKHKGHVPQRISLDLCTKVLYQFIESIFIKVSLLYLSCLSFA